MLVACRGSPRGRNSPVAGQQPDDALQYLAALAFGGPPATGRSQRRVPPPRSPSGCLRDSPRRRSRRNSCLPDIRFPGNPRRRDQSLRRPRRVLALLSLRIWAGRYNNHCCLLRNPLLLLQQNGCRRRACQDLTPDRRSLCYRRSPRTTSRTPEPIHFSHVGLDYLTHSPGAIGTCGWAPASLESTGPYPEHMNNQHANVITSIRRAGSPPITQLPHTRPHRPPRRASPPRTSSPAPDRHPIRPRSNAAFAETGAPATT